jgi:hypothetical protein
MKIQDIPGDQFGFRRGKGTTEAIRILRIISEQTLDIDELCACFTDWKKVFDRVNWTKLMQILKRYGTNWREKKIVQQTAQGLEC